MNSFKTDIERSTGHIFSQFPRGFLAVTLQWIKSHLCVPVYIYIYMCVCVCVPVYKRIKNMLPRKYSNWTNDQKELSSLSYLQWQMRYSRIISVPVHRNHNNWRALAFQFRITSKIILCMAATVAILGLLLVVWHQIAGLWWPEWNSLLQIEQAVVTIVHWHSIVVADLIIFTFLPVPILWGGRFLHVVKWHRSIGTQRSRCGSQSMVGWGTLRGTILIGRYLPRGSKQVSCFGSIGTQLVSHVLAFHW